MSDEPLQSITWNGTTFVAVGRLSPANGIYAPVILTTNDATQWTSRDAASFVQEQPLVSVLWDGGRFLAFGRDRTIQHSLDGIVWQSSDTPCREITPSPPPAGPGSNSSSPPVMEAPSFPRMGSTGP